MTYAEVSSINGSQGITGMMSFLNTVTYGWFINSLIISIWVIVATVYYKNNNNDYAGAFAVSSYVCFVLSLFIWLGDFMNNAVFSIITGITIISTIILFFDRE
jgi:hypothetical protein